VIAPVLGGMFIFSGVERSHAELALMSAQDLSAYRAFEAAMVRMPYLVLAGVVMVIALAVAQVRLPSLSRRRGGAMLRRRPDGCCASRGCCRRWWRSFSMWALRLASGASSSIS
jgi:fucose permease